MRRPSESAGRPTWTSSRKPGVTGILRHNGRFSPDADAIRGVRPGKHGREFVVADGADGKPIYVSESDVARLLQAKAAIAAGIVCLLNRVGLTPPDVQILYLAGGFGFHMDIENVIRCGLLPGFRPEQISLVGNTSLAGAVPGPAGQQRAGRDRDRSAPAWKRSN